MTADFSPFGPILSVATVTMRSMASVLGGVTIGVALAQGAPCTRYPSQYSDFALMSYDVLTALLWKE